ncbi:hypothetical protein DVH24_032437 [Malus domestica]|uniref:Uncharacterized protein n=1 Tax=Malus domestica TaxID=3750 RepID=A0A498J3L1_MALDO|nr:hypothetical protein DVH24_032437 [Malus domestica]
MVDLRSLGTFLLNIHNLQKLAYNFLCISFRHIFRELLRVILLLFLLFGFAPCPVRQEHRGFGILLLLVALGASPYTFCFY